MDNDDAHKYQSIIDSLQWAILLGILPHVIITSDTGRDPSVTDSTKSEYDAWFNNVPGSSKLESRRSFDIHGDFVDRDIVQYTELY